MQISCVLPRIDITITDSNGNDVLNYCAENQHFSVNVDALLMESASVGELFSELTHKAKMAFIKASMEQQSAMSKD